MLDSASPALGRLRGDIRVAYGRLQDKLQSIISSTQYATTLQEPLITMRNGRYVVPVKAAQRRNLRGLVHDQSGSGATLYIEPMAVVELNNKLRELQLAEEEEVQRILAALSEQVGAEAVAIIGGVEALARLDLFFAQARYSVALRCVEPEVVVFDLNQHADRRNPDDDGSPLLLTAARHPLLDQSKVVPTTMRLGGGWKLLLITGPNTGGGAQNHRPAGADGTGRRACTSPPRPHRASRSSARCSPTSATSKASSKAFPRSRRT